MLFYLKATTTTLLYFPADGNIASLYILSPHTASTFINAQNGRKNENSHLVSKLTHLSKASKRAARRGLHARGTPRGVNQSVHKQPTVFRGKRESSLSTRARRQEGKYKAALSHSPFSLSLSLSLSRGCDDEGVRHEAGGAAAERGKQNALSLSLSYSLASPARKQSLYR